MSEKLGMDELEEIWGSGESGGEHWDSLGKVRTDRDDEVRVGTRR